MRRVTGIRFSGPTEPAVQPNRVEVEQRILQVQRVLTPDLLSKAWYRKNHDSNNSLVGHCYVAAEALFHLLGGKIAGWQPYLLTHKWWPEGCDPGETHWFLKHRTGIIADPTAEQFSGPIAYDRGRPCGFLTSKPSKRAKTVLYRLNVSV